MTIKVGNGRGKKGDGLVIDRTSGKRMYKDARNIQGLSNGQLEALLANPNTRAKDIPKIKRLCTARGMC